MRSSARNSRTFDAATEGFMNYPMHREVPNLAVPTLFPVEGIAS